MSSAAIKNAPERMERLGADPVLPVLETKPDLAQVLDQLAGLMASDEPRGK